MGRAGAADLVVVVKGGRGWMGVVWFNDEAVRGAEPPVAASGWYKARTSNAGYT